MMSENNKEISGNPFILLKRIIFILHKKRKKQLLFVFILMCISSFAEIFTIATVLPFLNLIIDPNSLNNYQLFSKYINIIGLFINQSQLFVYTFIFCSGVLISGLLRITNLRINTLLSASIGVEISKNILKTNLSKDYPYFLKQNSSYIVTLATQYAGNTEVFIYYALQGLTNLVLSIFFLIILIFAAWKISLAVALTLGSFYLIFIFNNRGILYRTSKRIAKAQEDEVKIVQESIGGIRDIILDNTKEKYISKFVNTDIKLKKSVALNKFLTNFPRYLIESIILLSIGVIAYILADQNILKDNFSTLGLCLLTSQKLLPSIQQCYSNYTLMNSRVKGVQEVLQTFRSGRTFNIDTKIEEIKFNNKIELKNLYFKYESRDQNTLKDISLTIKKGERIGIIGTTGSGKSTLLDLIIGLLEPTNGSIKIDEKEIYNSEKVNINKSLILGWRSLISYVPQSIFLTDASIMENIAFVDNPENIKIGYVKKCAAQANLSSFIESLPNGYNTIVGERGFQLSGGQIQRLGIARALYKKCPIIVLDEATSSLDNNTERKVIESFNSLSQDLTIITVAHRLSTLRNYNKVITLEKGSIARICKPSEIL